jgi:3-oxoacyl-[acyl-carrier protein] reductase
MDSLSGRVAIVTGASQGIGRGIAIAFAEAGAAVACAARNIENLNETCAAIAAFGGKAIAIACDVRRLEDIEACVARTVDAFGGVDVLVNNAGIMTLATISESDDALFDHTIAVNLKGTFNTLREAARRLRDGGRIINFSSSITSRLVPTYGVYAATKAAVEAMTSILAKELRGRNITVNAIAPGPTATKLFLDGKPQEVVDQLSKMAPLERLGLPEDIADAVAFLAGPDGGWINGQTLRANGGII